MTQASRPPNVVVILADDLGYSDVGCYGGEIRTPHLDRLGRSGVRLSHFYNTAKCSPSRASLLTGRDPHETGIGILTRDERPHGYSGTMSSQWPTMAEHFKAGGYDTCLSGKWHLSSDTTTPNESWPTRRGFDEFYGVLTGFDHYFHPVALCHNEDKLPSPSHDFYMTDALSDHAAAWVAGRDPDTPFFLFLAYTAPHWPLQAPEGDIAPYAETYSAGWDQLREQRLERLKKETIFRDVELAPRDPEQPSWDASADKEWNARRMSTFAAMTSRMDAGVGRVLSALEASGRLDDTIVIFLSDNGGAAELAGDSDRGRTRRETPDGRPVTYGNRPEIWPGPADTFCAYGPAWANLSNTPFRLYKSWIHEGGISTPFIVHWPAGGLSDGSVLHEPFQLTDVLPTVLEAVGLPPNEGRGVSMLGTLRGRAEPTDHPLFWEHTGNCGIRDGRWKLVREAGRSWELYDISKDRSELHDLADGEPVLVAELAGRWQQWADLAGVLPWAPTPGSVEQVRPR